ncbi:MAG: sensor histidine kinase [Actinoplanes sp.]
MTVARPGWIPSSGAQLLFLLPYALLVTSVGAMLVAGDEVPHEPYAYGMLLAVLTGGWLLWWTTLHPAWQTDLRRMVIFMAGLLVLIFALVWASPLFGIFGWSGYLYVGYALPGMWRLVAGVGVATAASVSYVGGFSIVSVMAPQAFLVILAVNVVISGVMIYATTRADEEAAKRAETIGELAETNARLEAAMRENAGLHAQLLAQAREAGVLDERQRMAGEIHDVLAQGLTGIVTQLEAADAAATRPDDWRRHLGTAKSLARESLTEARRSVQALRPQTLDSAALPEAISEIVDGWSDRAGVPAKFITTGTHRPLLPEIETTLLRTAQEALANVARHADAGRVALTLSYMEDVVTLDVRDDGAGFDPAVPAPRSAEGGFGLAAMRERLLRIAGTLDVESEPGGGTALSACVPAIAVGAAA